MMGAEKTIIKKALEGTNWNRKKAAGQLGISYKSHLNKIKKYRLASPGRGPIVPTALCLAFLAPLALCLVPSPNS